MKALIPWFCLAAISHGVYAQTGIEAYRQGDYPLAASLLRGQATRSAAEDYALGRMYLYGYGVLKSNEWALRAFKQAADKGLLGAQLLMGRIALIQNNNPEQALYWFKKAAANDVSAQMYCAGAYLFGFGVNKNPDLARGYYIPAAKAGNSIAQYTLAANFLETHQSANKKLGLVWLEKALAAHDPEAELMMAELCLKGELVAQNSDQSKKLTEEAIAQGYKPAYYTMGLIEQSQSHAEAAQNWFAKATQAGVIPAAEHAAQPPEQRMAQWLTHGKAQRLADTAYALPGIFRVWQNTAALVDNIYNPYPVMNQLSREQLYHAQWAMIDPNSIPINQYYDAMVRAEGPLAQESLVLPAYVPHQPLHNQETSGPQNSLAIQRDGYDYLQAAASAASQGIEYHKLYQQLLNQALLGDNTAQFDVALMYQQGVGIEKSIPEAIKYYQMAAAQNDLPAEYQLGVLYLRGEEGLPADYQLALAWLTDAAFKGDYYAQYALARINEQGYEDAAHHGVIPANFEQAAAMYQLAAANHYGPAQYRLAEIMVRETPHDQSLAGLEARRNLIKKLYQGAAQSGVTAAQLPLAFYDALDPDASKQSAAFAVAQKAAASGASDAAFLLGMMYDRGIATAKNHDAAMDWYKKSASNPLAAFVLGTYLGSSADSANNHNYLQFALDKGFAPAGYNLAVLHYQQKQPFLPDLDSAIALGSNRAGLALADYHMTHGNDPQKLQQAHDLYLRFAQQGDSAAQVKLGYLYEQGIRVHQDYNQALHWYQIAAEQGYAPAQYLVGRLYQNGLIAKEPDYAMAKQWFAVAQNHYPPAAVAYAYIDETVDDDYQHALSGYQHASDLGDPLASYNLGLIYELGKNQPVDPNKAKTFYLQAANQGIIPAMVSLGRLYYNAKQGTDAVSWFNRAAALGDNHAQYYLGLMAEKGLGMWRNTTKAQEFYRQAALQGNAKAQYRLAVLCFSGELQGCDSEQAKIWLQQAQDSGSQPAARLLRRYAAQSQQEISYIESLESKDK